MMITNVVGDATKPQVAGPVIIAHITNNVGAWGAGFVVPLGKEYPRAKDDYNDRRQWRLGDSNIILVRRNVWVANMCAQRGITKRGDKIDYFYLNHCLQEVFYTANKIGATVHMPRIGSGLAGGNWNRILEMIMDAADKADVDVYIYTLPETPHEKEDSTD